MKKLILFLLVGMVLVGGVLAEECTIARPYFGSVNCLESEWSDPIQVYDGQEWTCNTENCEIGGLAPNDVTCTGIGTTSRLEIYNEYGTNLVPNCDSTIHPLGDECAHLFPISLRRGDKITVDFSCNFGTEPEGNPRVLIRYQKLELFKNIDSASNIPIPNTEFCNFNTQWDEYSKQLPNNEVLNFVTLSINSEFSGGEGSSNIPPSMNSVSLAPSQLGYMDAYWFIYDWVERPSLIVKTYQNQEVWCNPIDHSLTKLEEVNTMRNDCYLIPTSRLSITVECCSSGECQGQYKNQEIYCTDDFKCGFERFCLSDLDCSGTSERCQEENNKYYLVKSSCDKSEVDSYGGGSCQSDKEEVKCCSGNDGGPNVCGSGNYCDYEVGCKEVTYESSSGEIKTGVQGETKASEKSSGVTGAVIGDFKSSKTGIIILVVFLILIGGSIGFYFYNKNKKKTPSKPKPKPEPKEEPKEESKEEIIEIPKGKHCAKCGALLRDKVRFCGKCGGRVRR